MVVSLCARIWLQRGKCTVGGENWISPKPWFSQVRMTKCVRDKGDEAVYHGSKHSG